MADYTRYKAQFISLMEVLKKMEDRYAKDDLFVKDKKSTADQKNSPEDKQKALEDKHEALEDEQKALEDKKKALTDQMTVLRLIRDLKIFAHGQFLFFYNGFRERKDDCDASDFPKLSPQISAEDCTIQYPPERVLGSTIAQIATDVATIQLVVEQRISGLEIPVAEMDYDLITAADALAHKAVWLEPKMYHIPYYRKNRRVFTYLANSVQVRVLPYSHVVLLGIPYTCLQDVRSLMAIPHEVGHFRYWESEQQVVDLENLGRDWSALENRSLSLREIFYPFGDGGGPAQSPVSAWAEEIFADVYGTIIGGPLYIMTAMDRAMQYPTEGMVNFDSPDPHPTPLIRPLLMIKALKTLRSMGLTTALFVNTDPVDTAPDDATDDDAIDDIEIVDDETPSAATANAAPLAAATADDTTTDDTTTDAAPPFLINKTVDQVDEVTIQLFNRWKRMLKGSFLKFEEPPKSENTDCEPKKDADLKVCFIDRIVEAQVKKTVAWNSRNLDPQFPAEGLVLKALFALIRASHRSVVQQYEWGWPASAKTAEELEEFYNTAHDSIKSGIGAGIGQLRSDLVASSEEQRPPKPDPKPEELPEEWKGWVALESESASDLLSKGYFVDFPPEKDILYAGKVEEVMDPRARPTNESWLPIYGAGGWDTGAACVSGGKPWSK